MQLRRLVSAIVVSTGVAAVIIVTAGQTVVPRDWRRLKTVPAPTSPENHCAGRADTYWQVEFKAGVLAASRGSGRDRVQDPLPYELDFDQAIDVPPPAPPPDPVSGGRAEESSVWARRFAREFAARRVVRVPDGWLVGFDGGEYGGSLWWYPPAAGVGLKLWAQNVQAIEPLGAPGNYVALSGSDHVTSATAAVLWLNSDRGRWGIRRRAELDGQVWAHTVHPDGLLIATRKRVSVVGTDGSVRHLVSQRQVSATPTSLAVGPSADVAVGWRFFVSLLRRRGGGYDEEWLIPPACRRFKIISDFECTCRSV